MLVVHLPHHFQSSNNCRPKHISTIKWQSYVPSSPCVLWEYATTSIWCHILDRLLTWNLVMLVYNWTCHMSLLYYLPVNWIWHRCHKFKASSNNSLEKHSTKNCTFHHKKNEAAKFVFSGRKHLVHNRTEAVKLGFDEWVKLERSPFLH